MQACSTWLLEIASSVQTLVYVCVPGLRALTASHVKGMHNNWKSSFIAFPFLSLAINKLNGHGLSNTVCHECLPKKTKVMQYYVASEGLPDSSNELECLFQL